MGAVTPLSPSLEAQREDSGFLHVCGQVQKWVINLKSLLSLPPLGLEYLSECLSTYLKNKALCTPQGPWEIWGSMGLWHNLD